jgi:hypothetical protein
MMADKEYEETEEMLTVRMYSLAEHKPSHAPSYAMPAHPSQFKLLSGASHLAKLLG